MSDVEGLRAFYRVLADTELRDYCPLYERIALAMADEDELLERVVGVVPRDKIVPVLLFAAVRYLTLGEPDLALARIYDGAGDGDPWPAFRDLLMTRFEEIAAIMRARTIQTNEVGRAIVVLPALGEVHRRFGKPLALVELGPSAGLNLYLDRFAYDYHDGSTLGDPASPVRLWCDTKGNLVPPLPPSIPPIARREGIDLDPVDLDDDDACRWLEACVWPQVPLRGERLRAAIPLVRSARAADGRAATIHRGNAVDLLAEVLAAIDADLVPCVLSTWVLAYLSPDERSRVHEILDAAGASRDLAAITAEYPSIAPWIGPPHRQPAVEEGKGATVLGLATWHGGARDARPVAWVHAHGQWIDWLDAGSAGRPLA